MRSLLLLAALLTGSTIVSAQKPGSNEGGGGPVGMIQNRASRTPAEALFVEKCSMCHREMGMGTVTLARRVPAGQAMLEQRTDLTAEFVVVAARNGVGNMPRIPKGEVSDRQLDQIATYLAGRKK